ncbi:MAG: hypothetical protein JNK54_01935 [Elusimicrobia bacterium]|jgi:hypothetical protein|nr:hypothetical protein [Elusimicrobiota bacterium]
MNPKDTNEEARIIQYINLKLAARGQATYGGVSGDLLEVAWPLLQNHQEKSRLLAGHLCPPDRRIQDFLDAYLHEPEGLEPVSLPHLTFTLDRPGLARTLSLPPDQDEFSSSIIHTYRVKQGILHNPKSDRRTTAGVFHVAEGGFAVPWDKKAVPKVAFRNLFAAAVQPPEDNKILPFTSSQKEKVRVWVSLLLRPLVCPAVPGLRPEKRTEVRFFAPGSLISNLDFLERIFGNAGDPSLPANDAALDIDGWTGHTGCVILAPHLITLKKKDLGLPTRDQATERQKRDGMCWDHPDDLYNDGQAFKITARDERGVMVTLIADNYFGYCKKEVKTQISYSANLYGWAEEEHAGGAIAFSSYDLGVRFAQEVRALPQNGFTFADIAKNYGDLMEVQPEGYGVDRRFPDVLYVPEDAVFDMTSKTVSWEWDGVKRSLQLIARNVYILPNGYKVFLSHSVGGQGWHLRGTSAEGTVCHKPSTVSGGGKSEISKSIEDAMVQGPVFVADFPKDMDRVEAIIRRSYEDRFKDRQLVKNPSRPILGVDRSLGSVIKLLTPAASYSNEFNEWLRSIPSYIKDLVFIVKRFYHSDWGTDWRSHFSVDMVNGTSGHELKLDGRRLRATYLRVGFERDGSRRICRVRQDFSPTEKVQTEDDITASVVVPRESIVGLRAGEIHPSVKIVTNCERRLFQRPDEAIHPGYDKQAEADLSGNEVFLSNWEPMGPAEARTLVDDALSFELFTAPVRDLFHRFLADGKPAYIVSSARPRIVDGKPSKNPRYLQERPDLMNPRLVHVSEMGTRLYRKIPMGKPVPWVVDAVLPARRNNPPENTKKGIGAPPLCVYNPIHFEELPELFMDFVCSLTGKSPSTTGFGSEGALTKGPFNALPPVIDLNNAMVSYILTGYQGFTTAAGHVGPHIQVDHDISLLVPEIWARLSAEELDPAFLIREGYLEPVSDFVHEGKTVLASRLGYRITDKFVRGFLGRIFNNPTIVFTPEMLQPELQDLGVFVQGVNAIVEAQQRVAEDYFSDGSVALACPPLKALLHIMAKGSFEGKGPSHPDVRALFDRKNLLKSDWYQARLSAQQKKDIALWQRHVKHMEASLKSFPPEEYPLMGIDDRWAHAKKMLAEVKSPAYRESLVGCLGVDPASLSSK